MEHTMTAEQVAEVRASNAAASVSSRPEHVPEKFWDASTGTVRVEEMAKSYAAIESKMGGSNTDKLPSSPDDTTPADADEEAETPKGEEAETTDDGPLYGTAVNAAMTEAGIDPQELANEWAEKGEINPDVRGKLDATFGKDMVDRYIDGWKSQQAAAPADAKVEAPKDAPVTGPTEAEQAEIITEIGGKDYLASLLGWAGENLSAAEQTSFNEQVNKDAGASRMALQWLDGKMKASEGFDPEVTLKGDTSKPAGADVYTDWKQVTLDMAKKDASGRKQYDRDPAYRAKVAAKLKRSSLPA